MERARSEYSLYVPFTGVHEFTLAQGETTVTIDSVTEVLGVMQVYVEHPRIGDPYTWSPPLDNERYPGGWNPPNWGYIDAAYHDRYERYTYPVSWDRNFDKIILTPPYRLAYPISGVIVYWRVRDWDEIPDFHEGLILDRATVDYLDAYLVKSGRTGLVRVPTPHGSFEFDGGHNLRLFRDMLLANFEGKLDGRTPIITHG